jgi:UDP-N-acetylmuramoylalanine--D-glutamate ligase
VSNKIVILGSGESGVGSAILAKQKGYDVFVSDKGNIANKYKQQLLDENILFEENQHTTQKILEAKEVIKSPGISEQTEIVKNNYRK